MVEESIHVKFVERHVPREDRNPITHKSDEPIVQQVVNKERKDELSSSDDEKKVQDADDTDHLTLPCPWRFKKDHPPTNILDTVHEGVQTRSQFRDYMNVAFTSQVEPRKVDDAFLKVKWVNAIHEELEQFERNEVWKQVPRPAHLNVIGTKWIFKNKLNE